MAKKKPIPARPGPQTAAPEAGVERPVIVCTEYRGVFYGWAVDTSKDVIFLARARMAIYWGTTKGLFELAETGPTPKSKISARADLEVRKVSAVIEVAHEAVLAWENWHEVV